MAEVVLLGWSTLGIIMLFAFSPLCRSRGWGIVWILAAAPGLLVPTSINTASSEITIIWIYIWFSLPVIVGLCLFFGSPRILVLMVISGLDLLYGTGMAFGIDTYPFVRTLVGLTIALWPVVWRRRLLQVLPEADQ